MAEQPKGALDKVGDWLNKNYGSEARSEAVAGAKDFGKDAMKLAEQMFGKSEGSKEYDRQKAAEKAAKDAERQAEQNKANQIGSGELGQNIIQGGKAAQKAPKAAEVMKDLGI